MYYVGREDKRERWFLSKPNAFYFSFLLFLSLKHLYDQSTNADAASTAGKLLLPLLIMAQIPYLLMRSTEAKKFIENLVHRERALLLLSQIYEK